MRGEDKVVEVREFICKNVSVLRILKSGGMSFWLWRRWLKCTWLHLNSAYFSNWKHYCQQVCI